MLGIFTVAQAKKLPRGPGQAPQWHRLPVAPTPAPLTAALSRFTLRLPAPHWQRQSKSLHGCTPQSHMSDSDKLQTQMVQAIRGPCGSRGKFMPASNTEGQTIVCAVFR